MAIEGFSDWLETPQGRYVLDWEQAKHDQLVADIFGFNAVQIGLPQLDFLRANRMPFRFSCCDQGGCRGAGRSAASAVRRPTASISSCCRTSLEFDANPHQILREVERVLVPEGSVVITGFNPFSLWGVRRWLARRNGPPPWQGRYISVPRLKDWFALLGFETRAAPSAATRRPSRQEKWLRRWSFMDAAGDRWWPIAGARVCPAGDQAPARHAPDHAEMDTTAWRVPRRWRRSPQKPLTQKTDAMSAEQQ